MFLVGIELDAGELNKSIRKYATISGFGVFVPIICAFPVAALLYYGEDGWSEPKTSFVTFALFLGVAMGNSKFHQFSLKCLSFFGIARPCKNFDRKTHASASYGCVGFIDVRNG
jgi:Kef-type K+ transport system membrane component KefB